MSRRQREFEVDRLRRLDLVAAVVLLGLIVVVITRYTSTTPIRDTADTVASSSANLDPNTAPWWELTALPSIGETRAKAITDYRDQVRAQADDPTALVFHNPVDLESVSGIGPKTATKIAPYLTFPLPLLDP